MIFMAPSQHLLIGISSHRGMSCWNGEAMQVALSWQRRYL